MFVYQYGGKGGEPLNFFRFLVFGNLRPEIRTSTDGIDHRFITKQPNLF